jgi:CBS domain-containing protein
MTATFYSLEQTVLLAVVVENERSGNSNSKRRRLYGIFTERDLLTRVLSNDVSIDEGLLLHRVINGTYRNKSNRSGKNHAHKKYKETSVED